MLPKVVSSLHRLPWNPGSVIARGYSVVLGLIVFSLTGCGASSEQGPTVSTNPINGGVEVGLEWDSVNDSSVIGYYIHYGKQSPNQSGSCAYDRAMFVSSPQGIVTNLDAGSTYYFAVNAYNGVVGPCSNEVQAQT